MERTKLIETLSQYDADFPKKIKCMSLERQRSANKCYIAAALLVTFIPVGIIYTVLHAVLIYQASTASIATNFMKIGLQASLLVAMCQAAVYGYRAFMDFKKNYYLHSKDIKSIYRIVSTEENKQHLFSIADQSRSDIYKRAIRVAYSLPSTKFKQKENLVIHALQLVVDLGQASPQDGDQGASLS